MPKRLVPEPVSKPYHHGDLRRALLDAALALNTEVGLDGLTLREVSRRAGVSHAAAYRHFSNKAALIEALAHDGWQALTTQLNKTREEETGPAPTRIAALGVTYVQFAADQPSVFRLMVRPELYRGEHDALLAPAVEAAAQEAFAVLSRAIVDGQREGQIVAGDVQVLALTAWSTVHGLSVILLDTLVPHTADLVPLIAGSVTSTLVQGLAIPGTAL